VTGLKSVDNVDKKFMNKDQYLAKFDDERKRWKAMLSQLDEPLMNQPGVMGDWTFKDLVAHLTAWRERTAMRVETGCGIEANLPSWWPSGADDDSGAGTEHINQAIYATNHGRSVHDVLADEERVTRQLEDALRDLSNEALNSPDCFAWTDGKPLVEVDLFDHWHSEHEPQVRQWLAKLDRGAKW